MNRWVVLGVCIACGAAGFWANGARWEVRYQDLQLMHAKAEAARGTKNLEAVLENQAATLDAIQNWQYANAKNEAAYAQLTSTVSGLSRTVGGLRGDFAGLPGFVRDANREALGRYATACSAVFERLAEGGSRLAEAGSGLARRADQHSADAVMLSTPSDTAGHANRRQPQ